MSTGTAKKLAKKHQIFRSLQRSFGLLKNFKIKIYEKKVFNGGRKRKGWDKKKDDGRKDGKKMKKGWMKQWRKKLFLCGVNWVYWLTWW